MQSLNTTVTRNATVVPLTNMEGEFAVSGIILTLKEDTINLR